MFYFSSGARLPASFPVQIMDHVMNHIMVLAPIRNIFRQLQHPQRNMHNNENLYSPQMVERTNNKQKNNNEICTTQNTTPVQ